MCVLAFEDLLTTQMRNSAQDHFEYMVNDVPLTKHALIEEDSNPPTEPISFIGNQLDFHLKLFISGSSQLLESYGPLVENFYKQKILKSNEY